MPRRSIPDLGRPVIDRVLSDGTPVRLRPIGPGDEALMRAAIGQLSPESRYWRFFSSRPVPSDAVIRQLLDADGHHHIAWGATLANGNNAPAIGAVHVFRSTDDSTTGELSFVIADAWHGTGLVRMLLTALLDQCEHEGIQSLEIQVLRENRTALRLVHFLGSRLTSIQSGVATYAVATRVALERLGAPRDAIADVEAGAVPA